MTEEIRYKIHFSRKNTVNLIALDFEEEMNFSPAYTNLQPTQALHAWHAMFNASDNRKTSQTSVESGRD